MHSEFGNRLQKYSAPLTAYTSVGNKIYFENIRFQLFIPDLADPIKSTLGSLAFATVHNDVRVVDIHAREVKQVLNNKRIESERFLLYDTFLVLRHQSQA
jgi:hypothetical protein